MIVYEVELTSQAEQDLSEIYEYIAYDLLEFHNAKKQLNKIKQAIYKLDTFPERYKRYDKGEWKKRNLHYFPVDHYIVFYTVDQGLRKVIFIVAETLMNDGYILMFNNPFLISPGFRLLNFLIPYIIK